MAALAAPSVTNAGSIQVNVAGSPINGTQQCSDSPAITMTPDGTLQVSCTPTTTTGGVFSCSFANQIVGNTGNASLALTATCQNGTAPYTFAWTAVTAGAPAPDSATANPIHLNIPANTGTTSIVYQYRVVGTDSSATPQVANAYTGSVTETPAGSACATTAVWGTFTNPGTTFGPSPSWPTIPRTGYIAFALPVYTAARTSITLNAAESPISTSTSMQFVVSKCPGDFTFTQAACSSVKQQTGVAIYAVASATPVNGKCTLDLNTQYYLNARFVKYDASNNLVPSCSLASCGSVISYTSPN